MELTRTRESLFHGLAEAILEMVLVVIILAVMVRVLWLLRKRIIVGVL